MVTVVNCETAWEVMVKVAALVPAGTVTLAGTLAAAALLLDRVTVAPAAGARPLSVTVPVARLPPVTAEGDKVAD
jgi:hypothetical protein